MVSELPYDPDLVPSPTEDPDRAVGYVRSSLLYQFFRPGDADEFLASEAGCGCFVIVTFLAVAITLTVGLMSCLGDEGASDPAMPPSSSAPSGDADAPDVAAVPVDEAANDAATTPPAPTIPAPVPVAALLVPREGVWEILNQASAIACAGIEVPLPEVTQRGTITLLDGGTQLFANGFDADTADLLLTRTDATATSAVYMGEISPGQLGEVGAGAPLDLTLTFTMRFTASDQVEATTNGDFEIGGASCQIVRPATGNLVEPASNADITATAPVPTDAVGGGADGNGVLIGVCDVDTANEIVVIDDPISAPTPIGALDAFLAGPAPKPAVIEGLVELRTADGLIVEYSVLDESNVPTTAIRVRPTDTGFAVTEWETRGC